MTRSKSPGAVAALGASEVDQLGSTVDPINSPTNPSTQALPLRAGNAARCLACGSAINPQRASRRSYRCRNDASRESIGAVISNGSEPCVAPDRCQTCDAPRGKLPRSTVPFVTEIIKQFGRPARQSKFDALSINEIRKQLRIRADRSSVL
jgi:hypothetical protein